MPTFLVGFAVLPIRGVLYTLTDDPTLLVAVQLLDGIGAGIFGVVGVLVIADLTRGTGRFNLMHGALATATGLGASASHMLTGMIVSRGRLRCRLPRPSPPSPPPPWCSSDWRCPRRGPQAKARAFTIRWRDVPARATFTRRAAPPSLMASR